MSLNKGKAKVKAKSKSVAKGAGKNKAAVMNSRNPKKPMAISGDTMSNYAMYRAGGKVKKALPKHQDKGITGPPMDPKEKTRQKMLEYDKKFRQQYQEDINKKLLKKAQENTPSDDPKKIYQTGYKVPVRKKGGKVKKYQPGGLFRDVPGLNPIQDFRYNRLKNKESRLNEKASNISGKGGPGDPDFERKFEIYDKADNIHDRASELRQKMMQRKKGGTTKKYKAGGATKAQKFAALAPPYNKITAADRIAGAKKNARKKK